MCPILKEETFFKKHREERKVRAAAAKPLFRIRRICTKRNQQAGPGPLMQKHACLWEYMWKRVSERCVCVLGSLRLDHRI